MGSVALLYNVVKGRGVPGRRASLKTSTPSASERGENLSLFGLNCGAALASYRAGPRTKVQAEPD